ncbi:MAG: restriction endonuclease [bacterium]
MNIPIQNLYYILCYAWNTLDKQGIVQVDASQARNVAELCAMVLSNWLSYLLKKGLHRGYIDYSEAGSAIRGKINFTSSINKLLPQQAMMHCDFDELSYNVPLNQIIKATIANLLRCKEVSKKTKDPLAKLKRHLSDVQDIQLTAQHFERIHYHRHTSFYRLLISICQLIYENSLVNQEDGAVTFVDFLRDEEKMRKLYEAFVRNFYTKEGGCQCVGSKRFRWNCSPETDKDLITYLPTMNTDTSLETENQKIIIDTKYYSRGGLVDDKRGYGEKFNSGNLYQMFSYLHNSPKENNKPLTGILLYPTVGKDFSYSYRFENFKIRICTINLNQQWQLIHNDLLTLIN